MAYNVHNPINQIYEKNVYNDPDYDVSGIQLKNCLCHIERDREEQ